MSSLGFAVTALDEPGYSVHLEPEGSIYEVSPGHSLFLSFDPPPSGEAVEVTWTSTGLVVHRAVDSDAHVVTGDGRTLEW
jgi:hypothetical protein